MEKKKFSLSGFGIILGTILILGLMVLWVYYLSQLRTKKAQLQGVLIPVASVAATCQNIEKKLSQPQPGMPMCLDFNGRSVEEVSDVWPELPQELVGYSYELRGEFIEGLNQKKKVIVRCNIFNGSCEEVD